MSVEIGSIVEGVVFKLLKIGALVKLPDGEVGLVHISEIAHEYVREVEEHLHENDEVRIKVLGVNEQGRYELSIKALEPAPERPEGRSGGGGGGGGGFGGRRSTADLDDKLSDFMKRSQQRISEVRRREGRRRGGR